VTTLRKNFPALLLIGFFCAWSLGVWWYGFHIAQRSYIEQQQAKAEMLGYVIRQFVIDSRLQNCWDEARQDQWSNHFVLKKLVSNILSAAGSDPSIISIRVIARNGFVAWKKDFEGGRNGVEVLADIAYPKHKWGEVEIKADMSRLAMLRKVSISNILSMIFGVGIFMAIVLPRIRAWKS
jgi:hypothetical protein